MLPKYRIVDRAKFFRILRRTAAWVFSLTLGISLLVGYFFASTALTLNRGGKYCDYYNEGLIYYAPDDCYIEILALLDHAWPFALLAFCVFIVFFSSLALGMALLYLRYQHERLGLAKVGP